MKVLHSETIGWQLQQLGTLALNPFKLVSYWCSCSLGFLFLALALTLRLAYNTIPTMTMKSEAKLMSDINSHLQRLCYGTLHRLFTCNGSMLFC